jgi:vacuolar protein sorting-associated protein 3
LIDSGVDCFSEAEELLIQKARYYVLSRLYQSRSMAGKVLETWTKMIDGTWSDVDFQNGEERMKDYLIKFKDTDLLFKYAMWLVKRNPAVGVEVQRREISLM